MDYMCLIGSLDKSSTAMGSNDQRSMVGSIYIVVLGLLCCVPALFLSILIPLFFPTSVSFLIPFLLFPCVSVSENAHA